MEERYSRSNPDTYDRMSRANAGRMYDDDSRAYDGGRGYDARGGYGEPRPYTPQYAETPRRNASQYIGAGGVVINSPTTYEDVQILIDHLKMHEQVIVDFSNINQTSVYRILDFMSGAIYALDGSIQQITGNIFLFAPAGVSITVPPTIGRR